MDRDHVSDLANRLVHSDRITITLSSISDFVGFEPDHIISTSSSQSAMSVPEGGASSDLGEEDDLRQFLRNKIAQDKKARGDFERQRAQLSMASQDRYAYSKRGSLSLICVFFV